MEQMWNLGRGWDKVKARLSCSKTFSHALKLLWYMQTHPHSRRRTQTFSSDHFLDDADDNEGVLSCLAETDQQVQFFGLYPILNPSLPEQPSLNLPSSHHNTIHKNQLKPFFIWGLKNLVNMIGQNDESLECGALLSADRGAFARLFTIQCEALGQF